MKCFLSAILLGLIATVYSRTECVHRDYGYGATVCVCTAKVCDDLEPVKAPAAGMITLFSTSKDGDRFKKSELKWNVKPSDNSVRTQTIQIDRNRLLKQKIIGFGGAFTDASGINIKLLSEPLQQNIIKDYFGDTGIEYTMGRIPIGGSDFSTHPYSYNDDHKDDFDLKYFNLTKEDHDYKFPYIKAAIKASPHKLKLFGSPWAPPAWLKDNNKLNNGGFLLGKPGDKYYKTFAKYMVKFIDAYKANGVPIWGLTVDNEPKCGSDPDYKFNCLGLTPEIQRDFLKLDLGPILEAAGYGLNTTQLMIFDDQRTQVYRWAQTILTDKDAAKYVSGTAFHWYENTPENLENLDFAHDVDPSKYLINTESCEEWRGKEKHVYLGHWDTFDRYAYDIITDLNHWTVGWVDWNLVLDRQGGPNWVQNFVDAPIIVNETAQEYYKQPFFYALGHFSKFLLPDSIRVYKTQNEKIDKFESTVFVRPDNVTVVIALNMNNFSVILNVDDTLTGSQLYQDVKPHSIQTYLFGKI